MTIFQAGGCGERAGLRGRVLQFERASKDVFINSRVLFRRPGMMINKLIK